ncbi:hypothetical protein [Actinomadura hibisca]|uniref:hypothetical protein n=1 Tax=Actinomadura hibisca TaxID=68565 RepID=UPI00082AD96C|nr:hypothetical protein [Actinomadura hibisca]
MAAYTNMSWPDDPYGTGQLWRKEPQLAAAFDVQLVHAESSLVALGYAVVYLPLHRTKSVVPTAVSRFGFRAISAADRAEIDELLKCFELDVSRARRLAKVVIGYRLEDALRAIENMVPNAAEHRGITALADAWPSGRNPSGMAELCEITAVEPCGTDLAETAARFGIGMTPPPSTISPAAEAIGSHTTQRSLVSGLIGLRHLGRYRWESELDAGAHLAANAADCFPSQTFAAPSSVNPAT